MTKPWLEHAHWPRTVRSNARRGLRATWAFTLFWLLCTSPVLFVIPEELAKENWLALLAFLFPLVGVGMLAYAVKITREWRKYGATELTLDPYPGSLGGHVGGTIDVRPTRGEETFEVVLQCVYSCMSGSGKNRSRREEVRWQAAGPAVPTPRGLEFRFDVPADLPASEEKAGNSYHYWRLQLRNDAPQVPLDRSFDVGVFATAQTSQHIAVDTTAAGRDSAAQALAGALEDPARAREIREKHGLSVERRGDWLRMVLHTGRQKGMALGMFAAGAAFAAVGLFVPPDDFSATLIKWVFGIFGWCLVLGACYVPFNRLEVRVGPAEIKRVRAWLGIVIRRQRIRPAQLRELAIKRGSSTQVGARTTIYYRLVGKGPFGEFRFLESISDKPLVEALRDRVMEYAGLAQTR